MPAMQEALAACLNHINQAETAMNTANANATDRAPRTFIRRPQNVPLTTEGTMPEAPRAANEAARKTHSTSPNFLDWWESSSMTTEEYQLIGAKLMNAMVKRSLFAADLSVKRDEVFQPDEPTLDQRNEQDEAKRGDEASDWVRNAQGLEVNRKAWEDVRDLEKMRRYILASLREVTIDLLGIDDEAALYHSLDFTPLGIQSARAQQKRDIDRAGVVSAPRRAAIEAAQATAKFQRSTGGALKLAEEEAKRNQEQMKSRRHVVIGFMMELGIVDDAGEPSCLWMRLNDTIRERLVADVITGFEFSLERLEAKRDASVGRRRQEYSSALLDMECAYEEVKAWYHEHYGQEDVTLAGDIKTKAARLARLKGVAELTDDVI